FVPLAAVQDAPSTSDNTSPRPWRNDRATHPPPTLRQPQAALVSDGMAEKRYLLTPGPTPVPPEVLAELAKPVIHHRERDYREIYEQCLVRLQDVYRTQHDVLMYTTSGTGAFESAV